MIRVQHGASRRDDAEVLDRTERSPANERRTGGRNGLSRSVPSWLVTWGERAWWAIGIAIAVAVAWMSLSQIRVVVIPILLSLFPAAVLLTPVRWLREKGVARSLSALLALLLSASVIAGIGAVVSGPLISGLSQVGGEVAEAYESFRTWLADGPLGISNTQLDGYIESMFGAVNENGQSAVLGGAFTVVEIIVGSVTAVVVLFFILKDADQVSDAALERLSDERRETVTRALHAGRDTLAYYVGGLALVGIFDAIFIGLGLYLIGVPLALPVAVIAFFGSFFPLVGAWVGGLIGVAVAFADGGLQTALLALAIITAVEQVEANVVAPVVFRHTLQLHPIITIIAILAGGAAFGIVGAFLAVPLIAVTVAVRQSMLADPDASMLALVRIR